MKKHSLLCFVVIFCIGIFTSGNVAKAASEGMKNVSVNEGSFSIEVPFSCHVLQQEIAEDDPYLEQMGANREQIEEYYRQSGIVLHVIAPDNSYEMVVTMNHNQSVKYIYNMKSLSNDILQNLQDTVCQSYITYGYQIKDKALYENDEMKYLVFHFGQTVEDKKIDCLQYYFIKGSKVYNFTMRYYGDEIPYDLTMRMETMIDSIRFFNKEWVASYDDKESGVSLQIKEGWDKVGSADAGNTVKAQFLHTNGLGESILFLTIDLWSEMDTLHQLVKSRDKIYLDQNTKETDKKVYMERLSSFLGDAEYVSVEKIADTYYLIPKNTIQLEEHQAQGVYVQRNAVAIRNGLAYIFQYGFFEGNNIHETDFEQMLQNINYGEPKLAEKDKVAQEKMQVLKNGIIAAGVLVIAILILITYLYFFSSARNQEDK